MKWIEWGVKNTHRYAAIIVTVIIIVTEILNSIFLYYVSPSAFIIPNIFHASIETVPIDMGWLGLVFILANGFLLSYIIVKEGDDIAERVLLSIGLGFGVTCVMMILIGILWEISLLTVSVTQVSLFGFLLLAALYRGVKPNFGDHLRLKRKDSDIPKFKLLEAILLIVIGIFAVFAIYQTIAYPPREWDSLAYGVNYARIIFENGKIPLIAGPSIGLEMSANYPPGVQLLASDLYVFAGNAADFYYRILQPIFGLTTILATYKFATAVTKNRTLAVLAIFALASMSTFWELFVYETYLMCLTLMLTLAALFFFKAHNLSDAEARKYEVAGTLFCGFAALTSYIGLFSLGILLLYSIKRKVSAKRFGELAILASIIILPWYMRNLILLGNPLYPFFGVGNYLDPLLLKSLMQHFQNWSNYPYFSVFSRICVMGMVLLFLAIAFFTVAKRKQFHLIFPFYLFLVGLTIMGVHIPFVRYLVIALPALAVIFAASTKALRPPHTLLERSSAVALILLVLVSSVMVLPAINAIKPTPTRHGDKWSYLSQVFEEGDAWQWINENTPEGARIATYDIKEYYLEREVFALDGSEAAPLYKMDTVEECIAFLEKNNVTYILSVPWATPLDTRMPPAYEQCLLTRYLGDPSHLPPVFVGMNGTAVYYVGPLEDETAYTYFTQKNLAPPTKHVKVNLSVTNSTVPSSGKFYIPIPVDYKDGVMAASVNSSKQLVTVELWNGIIPETTNTSLLDKYQLVESWPNQPADSSGVEDPSFTWQINKTGYFTFLIVNQDNRSLNSTVDIRFYNYWDKNSLVIP